jgi:dTDP-glucose pyrophosphorylase
MLRDHRVMAIQATAWQQVGYPDDLERAAEFLKANRHLL